MPNATFYLVRFVTKRGHLSASYFQASFLDAANKTALFDMLDDIGSLNVLFSD